MTHTILGGGAWIIPDAELMKGTMIFFFVGMFIGGALGLLPFLSAKR